jgi:hypothetical protein
MKEPHLLTNRTVAFVDADCIPAFSRFHIRWKLELELVLHVSAMAGT